MNVVLACVAAISWSVNWHVICSWILVCGVLIAYACYSMLIISVRNNYGLGADQLGCEKNNYNNKKGDILKMINIILLITATVLLWDTARWFGIVAIVWLILQLIAVAYKIGKEQGGKNGTE